MRSNRRRVACKACAVAWSTCQKSSSPSAKAASRARLPAPVRAWNARDTTGETSSRTRCPQEPTAVPCRSNSVIKIR